MDSPTLINTNQQLTDLWLLALILGLTTHLLARWRRRLGLIPLSIAALVSILMWLELSDPAFAGGLEIAFGSRHLLHARLAGWSPISLAALAYALAPKSKRVAG